LSTNFHLWLSVFKVALVAYLLRTTDHDIPISLIYRCLSAGHYVESSRWITSGVLCALCHYLI
jgi:hypothetical protein